GCTSCLPRTSGPRGSRTARRRRNSSSTERPSKERRFERGLCPRNRVLGAAAASDRWGVSGGAAPRERASKERRFERGLCPRNRGLGAAAGSDRWGVRGGAAPAASRVLE